MKAAIFNKYGGPDVFQIMDIPKPIVKDNEILIKMKAGTVTTGEVRIRSMNVPTGFGIMMRLIFGITAPRNNLLGGEFAGVIESIGKDVRSFKIGDEVFGFTGVRYGANAEYLSVEENSCVAIKPKNMSFEEAACVPFGGLTSQYFIRILKIKKGEKVLINGASGSLGTSAVQIAKYIGAEVTAVCSEDNVEMVKSIGADKVINYKKEDLTKNGQKYDVIYDTVGNLSFSKIENSLNENGRFGQAVGGIPFYLNAFLQNFISLIIGRKKKIISGVGTEDLKDLIFLKDLIEKGKYKSVIDKIFPLEQISDAHRIVDSGHKKGNVVIVF